MIGDQTLFQRADMVEETWAVIKPIQEVWKALPANFPNYAAGTCGPKEADSLLQREGCEWKRMEEAAAAVA
jgi:glucose-6-phosphate 1-dehydrogenase